jgi:hypothetical protein
MMLVSISTKAKCNSCTYFDFKHNDFLLRSLCGAKRFSTNRIIERANEYYATKANLDLDLSHVAHSRASCMRLGLFTESL